MPPEYYFAAIAILIVLGLIAFTFIGNRPRRRVLRKNVPSKSVLRAPTQNDELVDRLERIEDAVKAIVDHLQALENAAPGSAEPHAVPQERVSVSPEEASLHRAEHADSETLPPRQDGLATPGETPQAAQKGDEPKKHRYVKLSMFGR